MFTTWREYTITNHVEPHVMDQLPRDTCLAHVLNAIEAEGTPVERIILHRLNADFTLVLVAVGAPAAPLPEQDLHADMRASGLQFLAVGGNMTADYKEDLADQFGARDHLPVIAWQITPDGLVPWVFDHDNQAKPAHEVTPFTFVGITLFR